MNVNRFTTAGEDRRQVSGTAAAPDTVTPVAPQFLTFPPVRTGWIHSATAEIRSLTPEGRPGSSPVPMTFSNTDLTSWVCRFLEDLDRFVDKTVDGPILRRLREHRRQRGLGLRSLGLKADRLPASAVTLVLDSQDRIADVLAATFQAILEVPAASAESDAGIAAAREELRHRLAFSFQPFLQTCMVIQDVLPAGSKLHRLIHRIAEPDRHRTAWMDLPWRIAGLPHRPTRVRVPVPLRIPPSLPCLVGQSGVASHPDSPRLQESARWTYALMVSYPLAPQDHLEIAIDINAKPRARRMRSADEGPLFGALAQYNAVAEALWTRLNRTDTDTDTDTDPVINDPPVQTFVELALGIAEAWEQDLTRPRSWPPDPVEPAFQYAVQLCLPEDQLDPMTPGFACLEVRAVDPSVHTDLGWPRIQVTSADGVGMNLERETVTGSTALYRPANDARWPSGEIFRFEFSWPDLRVATHQSAQGRIRVIRNADLLRTTSGMSDHPGPETQPEFLMTTEIIGATAPVIPVIHPSCVLPLEGPDLGTALEATLTLLFGDNPLQSQARVSLSHCSSPLGDLGVEVVQPVGLALLIPLKDVPKACAQRAHDWVSQQGSPVVGGRWQVELIVYSALDDASPLPIYSGRFCYPGTTVKPA